VGGRLNGEGEQNRKADTSTTSKNPNRNDN